MNQCTRCGGEVPEIAQACMHCGAEFTNTPEYIARVKANEEAEQQGAVWGCGIVVLAVVLALIAWSLGWEPYGY